MAAPLRRYGGLLAALLVMALVGSVTVPRAASAQSQAGRPSAEEAVLGLLPYRLQSADLPRGFQPAATLVETPSSLAIGQSVSASDARDTLRMIQGQGLVVELAQAFTPDLSTPIREFVFEVDLLTSPRLASAAMADALDPPSGSGVAADNPPLPERFGEESGALHVTITTPQSDNQALELIVWRRGSLVFTAGMIVLDGTETLEQVLPLAEAADRRAAAQTPPDTSTRTLPAAGDEAARLEGLLAMLTRLPAAADAPLGFVSAGIGLVNNADLPASAADPKTMYGRLAQWKRLAAVRRTYNTPQQNDGNVIRVQYALSADNAGAAAYLADQEFPDGATVQSFALSTPLGDAGRLYRATYTSSTGVPRETWRAVWTHATVVLSVSGDGAVGQFTAAQIAGLASDTDARYAQGSIPDVLTQPLPAPPPPIISGNPHVDALLRLVGS